VKNPLKEKSFEFDVEELIRLLTSIIKTIKVKLKI